MGFYLLSQWHVVTFTVGIIQIFPEKSEDNRKKRSISKTAKQTNIRKHIAHATINKTSVNYSIIDALKHGSTLLNDPTCYSMLGFHEIIKLSLVPSPQ